MRISYDQTESGDFILDPRNCGFYQSQSQTDYERLNGIPETIISTMPTDIGPIPQADNTEYAKMDIGYYTDALQLASTPHKKDGRDFVHVNLFLKMPDSPVVVPYELRQFLPIIEMAARVHYEEKGYNPNDAILLKISQGHMRGMGDTFRGAARHADFNPQLAHNNAVHNHDVYMASNIYTTLFYEGEFNTGLPENSRNMTGREITNHLCFVYNTKGEALETQGKCNPTPPGHVMNFDSLGVHKAEDNIPEEADRTFIQLVFMPAADIPQNAQSGNPALNNYLQRNLG